MSKPLSLLATIFLLIAPSLLADRCTAECPTVHPCTVMSEGDLSVPAGPAEPETSTSERGRHRPVWRGHARWVFVAQGLVISIVHQSVLDRSSEAE